MRRAGIIPENMKSGVIEMTGDQFIEMIKGLNKKAEDAQKPENEPGKGGDE